MSDVSVVFSCVLAQVIYAVCKPIPLCTVCFFLLASVFPLGDIFIRESWHVHVHRQIMYVRMYGSKHLSVYQVRGIAMSLGYSACRM